MLFFSSRNMSASVRLESSYRLFFEFEPPGHIMAAVKVEERERLEIAKLVTIERIYCPEDRSRHKKHVHENV